MEKGDLFNINVFCMLMDDKFSICIYEDKLNSEKYVGILRSTVSGFLDNLPINLCQNRWYQLNGAPGTCTSGVSRELTDMFEDRWIQRLGLWIWSPLDFYLWGKERYIELLSIRNNN